ncbi:MAG: sigma-70 family RNA polymerase sigma factor [Bacteroidota bacterium]
MNKEENTCSEKTFRILYEQYSDALRNFMYYKSKDSGFAEDAVQDAYVQLWKNCVSVPVEKARGFLFKVLNNKLLDRFKHQKVQLKFKALPVKTHTVEDPEFLLEEQEFRDKLNKAIDSLPEPQRLVFLMNRIDQLKYREIAEALGISQKAVEKRMHKALLYLRAQIGNI